MNDDDVLFICAIPPTVPVTVSGKGEQMQCTMRNGCAIS